MVLPGHLALKLIEGATNAEAQEQPAGVDLTVRQVFGFKSGGTLGVNDKKLPETVEIPPEGSKWRLGPGAYKIVYNEIVSVPEDHVGLCFPRSTLLRMGATVECAVWDPGYKGRGSSLLLVLNPSGIAIERGSRIVQIVFIKVQERSRKAYSGAYQHENI
uniref:Deoxyuridine 5'-triphosphate nucleotidohydrolase n=1 Tax=Fervidicoccus fontis TaxID=683846 RepID=A0A7J3ZJU1_9CREN